MNGMSEKDSFKDSCFFLNVEPNHLLLKNGLFFEGKQFLESNPFSPKSAYLRSHSQKSQPIYKGINTSFMR
jgi:hypothetical protein